MNNNFLVSVIVPIYNGEKTLRRAIASAVSQSCFNDMEIILIEDCSHDNSEEIAQGFCDRYPDNIFLYKNKTNQGIAKTQNIGLKKSHGQYIARIDQDDEWCDKHKIKKQLKTFEKNPKIGLVGTWANVINEDGPDFRLTPPSEDIAIRQQFLMASMFVSPSVMFKRELIDQIGFYRDDLKYGTEDYEYWLRIGTIAQLANIPEFCIKYHFHQTSYSNQKKVQALVEHAQIIKEYSNVYPNFRIAYLKNRIQSQMLRSILMRKVYNYIVPRIAGKIYK